MTQLDAFLSLHLALAMRQAVASGLTPEQAERKVRELVSRELDSNVLERVSG